LSRFEEHVGPSALYDASLCLSELVTNAVQHPAEVGGGEIEVEFALTEDALRVRVRDTGGGFEPPEPTEGDERGWGLFIIDQLATRWGAEPGDRTVLWFEIARAGASSSSAETSSESEDDDGEPAGRDRVANMVARLRLRPLAR
jgi:hypothetical protein